MDNNERLVHDIWLGSELGVLKGYNVAAGSFVNYGDIKELSKSDSITSMCWKGNNKQEILLGLKNGTVKSFSLPTCNFLSHVLNCGEDSVCGVIALEDGATVALEDGATVTSMENGVVQLWKEGEVSVEKKVGENLAKCISDKTCKFIATGGKENDLKVWDLSDFDKPIFAAKNVKNDSLNLRVPVWLRDIAFLQDDDTKILTCGGYKHIRLYDRKAQRRPVLDVTWHEHPINSLSVTPNGDGVVIGNSAGYMATIDLRTGKCIGGYKGNVGSIRSVKCHQTQQIVVSCGLDRFAKIYDLNSRKLLKKVYMKSNLNCMLLPDVEIQLEEQKMDGPLKRAKEEVISDDEDGNEKEDIWDSMETVKDGGPKKKKKIKDGGPKKKKKKLET